MVLIFIFQDGFGDLCFDFIFLGVDGKIYLKKDFVNGYFLVVMFICNYCFYV